jgi:SET domain
MTAPYGNATNNVEKTQGIPTSPGMEVVEPTGRPYDIRAIAGKGKGLVATTRIAKGTRLLSEVPIFRVPRDNPDIEALERIIANEVNCLDDDQQRAFFDLTNIYGNTHSQSLGIARTNVLPLGSRARSGGLFLEASRINHSCRHNAQNTWNENIGRLTIHALRDIEAGQEITISYLASTSEYAERQRFLKEKFKFECKCELCSLPRAQRKHSDTRLRKLQAIDKSIGAFFWGELEPEMALQLLHTMFGLFDEEGIWDASIARAYKDAYDIATENEDGSRARVFAERAYDTRRLIEGDDSPVTVEMKQAAEELSAQTPQGMNEAGFENWLWMLNGTSES